MGERGSCRAWLWFGRSLSLPVDWKLPLALLAKRRAVKRVFEQLESRLLLADTPIDDQTMNALLTGLDGISGVGDRMSASGQFAEPIRPFSKADRTILTPGGIAPIGRTVNDNIGNPVIKSEIRYEISSTINPSLIALATL